MSYGFRGLDADTLLTRDDMIGASLRRPRDGWLERTGSIIGRVTLPDGAGASRVSVVATLLEPDSRAHSVVVQTERSGHYEIRGLEPGGYQLLVRSMVNRAALFPGVLNPRRGVVELHLRQTLRAGPVRVRADAESVAPFAVRRWTEPYP